MLPSTPQPQSQPATSEQPTVAPAQTMHQVNVPITNAASTQSTGNSRASSPQNGRASTAPDDPRSFADVTAGRPATPLPLGTDGMPRTPRLRPTLVLDDIPYLRLAAPSTNAEQATGSLAPSELQDTASYPPLEAATTTPAPVAETAKSKKAARKLAAKLKKAANLDKGSPPPAESPQPSEEALGPDGRKRRRVSRERVDDGGESSQQQPVVRLQQSPGPSFAQTIPTSPSPSTAPAPTPNIDLEAVTLHNVAQRKGKPARPTFDFVNAPPHPAHPFADWDPVNGGFIWDRPQMTADPHWRPNMTSRRTGGSPLDAPLSDDSSFYAPSLDEMIRSYRSPPPGLAELSPAQRLSGIVPPAAPPQPRFPPELSANNHAQEQQQRPNTRPQDPPAMNLDMASDPNGSILAPPWHKEPGQPRRNFTANANLRYKPYPGSSGRQMPIAAPIPRRPSYVPRTAAAPEAPTTPRPRSLVPTLRSEQRADNRADSRASVLTYVSVRPTGDGRPSPIDVDAMSIEGDGIEIIQPPSMFQNAQPAANQPTQPQTFSQFAFQPAPQPPSPPPPAFEPAMFDNEAPPDPLDDHVAQAIDHLDNPVEGPTSGIDWATVEFTAEPEGKWRKIQFRSPEGMFEGQSERQVKQWRALAANVRCVLVMFAHHGACDKDSEYWTRASLLQELLRYRFDVSERQLLAPEPAPGRRNGLNIGPWCFLVHNLSELQEFVLANFGWCSSRYLSVHFSRFPPPPPDFLTILDGSLAFMSTEPLVVRRIVVANFQREPLLSTTIDVIRDDKKAGAKGKWGDTAIKDAYRSIVESIEVRVMPRQLKKGTPNPLFVIYCDPPTISSRGWATFREAVRRQPFGMPGGAPAVVSTEEFQCKLCHSMDHKVGLCDLPKLDDWYGPRPTEDDQVPPPPARGNSNKRGGNGKKGGWQNNDRNRGRNGNAAASGSGSSQGIDATTHAAFARMAGKDWYSKK
ncbi:hypothetical protein EVJ58_g667 [Rhodofomes roseus]|uniref:Uncharacterized protein n=1 Tax=Rhodofomes roseus TaxID=34475 RepID=A0A4Y9Z2D9_9APHY|nr:hypothetical protein EVJ58_g667 [Rhodofomes roseus]